MLSHRKLWIRIAIAAFVVTLGVAFGTAPNPFPFAAPTASGSTAWSTKLPMPTPRKALGVATGSNGKIYAIGGYNSDFYITTVEQYDPATDSWIPKLDMRVPRSGLGLASAASGKIYAVGGLNHQLYLKAVEEFDPAAGSLGSWTTKTDMPTARHSLGAVVANNGRVYAIGGYNGGYLATVEEYDPATNSWSTRNPMGAPRSVPGVVAATNGKIYAVGGYNASGYLATVEEYDPAAGPLGPDGRPMGAWTTRASMPTPRRAMGLTAASNGKIYAIGGENATNYLATVEVYDPATNTWVRATSMPTTRNALGATAATSGKIYAMGGYNSTGYLKTVEEYDPVVVMTYALHLPVVLKLAVLNPTPKPTPEPLNCPDGQYLAQYFDNRNLSGPAVIVRCEGAPLRHDWGEGSPGPGVPVDFFTARWVGRFSFATAGTYTFTAISDDGVRVAVDGIDIIDDLTEYSGTRREAIYLNSGPHEVKVEYLEAYAGASIELTWSLGP